MTRTFLDSGVLIALAHAKREPAEAARRMVYDSDRVFVTSPFLELEVLPHSERLGRTSDVQTYREYFGGAEKIDDLEAMVNAARQVLLAEPLKLADALHVAACLLADVDELVTTEGPGKPLRRTRLVKVVPLV